ncbi:MAG: CDP-diacylglycerol--glycerol-3-phosphate 3-phosphatidyltransferase [Alcaligenaceae bacterium]|nr:CDP-diacylglycerol--glycerol-3-phosphate 3-phosphatidyltransferase [Alcaligenaceae bacterium]
MKNIPMTLTWMRVALIPLILCLYLPIFHDFAVARDIFAAFAFAFAAFTDFIDGFLARKWGQATPFGAFLDPVADKLLVCACLLILLVWDRAGIIPVLVIIGREILISSLREWMATMGRRGQVAVHWIGKLKTGFQMLAIVLLLLGHNFFDLPIIKIGTVCLYIAMTLTLISMGYYFYQAWSVLREEDYAA